MSWPWRPPCLYIDLEGLRYEFWLFSILVSLQKGNAHLYCKKTKNVRFMRIKTSKHTFHVFNKIKVSRVPLWVGHCHLYFKLKVFFNIYFFILIFSMFKEPEMVLMQMPVLSGMYLCPNWKLTTTQVNMHKLKTHNNTSKYTQTENSQLYK